MRRFDYYDFELAETEPHDDMFAVSLTSKINTETMKVLINREHQLFKRIQELEKRIETTEAKTNESN